MKISEFKIGNLAAPDFDDSPHYAFDFKRNLRADVALDKITTKNNQGRPSKAEYFHESVKYAEIEYLFETDDVNFITRRTELLRYVLLDGTLGDPVMIKDKHYDMANASDVEAVINEREKARASIIVEIKGFISGVMQQVLGFSIPQVVANAKPFWSQYHSEITNFIDFGSEDFKAAVLSIDLNFTPYTWMGTIINEEGATVQSYIYNRLSY